MCQPYKLMCHPRKLFWHFQRSYPQVLYLFGNLSRPPTWIQTQMPKFCKFFCNPFLQTQNMKTSRDPNPKCHTFLETSHDPLLESQLRWKILQFFLQPHFTNNSKTPPQRFWNLHLTLFLIPSSLNPLPHTLLTLPFTLYPPHFTLSPCN